MSLRFTDGFDHYATADILKKYNLTAGDFAIFSGGRFGGSYLKCGGGGFEATAKTLDAQPSWVLGFAFRYVALPPAGTTWTISSLYDTAAGQSQCSIAINSSGKLVLLRGTTVLLTGTTVLVPNAWYYVEWKATISTSVAANSCIVRIGGVNEIVLAAAQSTQSSVNAYADQVQLNSNQGGTFFPSFDDFYVCDGVNTGTGSRHDFLGEVRVETIFPAGILSAGWSPTPAGTGLNYARVQEAAEDGDTSYVSTGTVGAFDTYTWSGLSSTPTRIFGMQFCNTARIDDAGPHVLQQNYIYSGTTYHPKDWPLSSSYLCYTAPVEANPLNGSDWTAADINGLGAGFVLES